MRCSKTHLVRFRPRKYYTPEVAAAQPTFHLIAIAAQQPLRMRARAIGGVTLIHALIDYKIDTGLVRNKQTKQFEVKELQRFVKTVSVALNGKQIFAANLSIASSNDPFIAVKVKDGKEGDKLTVRWEDNQGDWGELRSPFGA